MYLLGSRVAFALEYNVMSSLEHKRRIGTRRSLSVKYFISKILAFRREQHEPEPLFRSKCAGSRHLKEKLRERLAFTRKLPDGAPSQAHQRP
jgi:hypothetical protein